HATKCGRRARFRLHCVAVGDERISLSYAVPVYNEAAIIDSTIAIFLRDLEHLSETIRDFELIVVDDASDDGTTAIVEAWAARDARVKVIRHARNQGVGVGIQTALAHATREWFAVNCADRPFDTREIARFRSLFQTADVVVVSRTDRRANTWYRKLTSWVNYGLLVLLFRVPVNDCQFIQFYRRSCLRDVALMARGTLVPPEL